MSTIPHTPFRLTPILTPVAAVQARDLLWLWPGLIPRGKLTILCGDPGLGKSFITLDIASRVSRGGPWPCRSDDDSNSNNSNESARTAPGSVILLSAEDDAADTIRPRLEAMGADLERVCVLDGFADRHGNIYDFVIGENTEHLREIVEQHRHVRLIVVDPVSAYVGGVDSYNNAQVRAMLSPLARLAADLDVAVVLVTHLRKGESAQVIYRAMGSLAFAAAARVVLVVSKVQNSATERIMMTVKSNLGNDRRGFTYRIEEGKVQWKGEVDIDADEAMGTTGGDDREGGGGRARMPTVAAAFRETLLQVMRERGQISVKEIRRMCTKSGVSFDNIKSSSFRDVNQIEVVQINSEWVWRRRPGVSSQHDPLGQGGGGRGQIGVGGEGGGCGAGGGGSPLVRRVRARSRVIRPAPSLGASPSDKDCGGSVSSRDQPR